MRVGRTSDDEMDGHPVLEPESPARSAPPFLLSLPMDVRSGNLQLCLVPISYSAQRQPGTVGLVSSIGFFAAAISMIPGGILANKYDNRTLLIIGWAMSIPVPILFYFSRAWSDVIPGLILLQLSAFNVPAMNAFISALGDQKRMSSAFGAVYSAFPLGLVLSPAVGSLLLTWLSIRDLFWFTLALWTVSTIILFPLKLQQRREVVPKLQLLQLPSS